jgi:hypothetical protein
MPVFGSPDAATQRMGTPVDKISLKIISKRWFSSFIAEICNCKIAFLNRYSAVKSKCHGGLPMPANIELCSRAAVQIAARTSNAIPQANLGAGEALRLEIFSLFFVDMSTTYACGLFLCWTFCWTFYWTLSFLSSSELPLPYVLLKTSSISTILWPSDRTLPQGQQDRLPRSEPDQRQSLKAVATRDTASRLRP